MLNFQDPGARRDHHEFVSELVKEYRRKWRRMTALAESPEYQEYCRDQAERLRLLTRAAG